MARKREYPLALLSYTLPEFYAITIISMIKVFYRLYKKRIIYTDIPIVFSFIAFVFDIYKGLVCFYYLYRTKEEEDMIIEYPLLIIQLLIEVLLILTFLFNLANYKLGYFILEILVFEVIIAAIVYLLITVNNVRYIFSIAIPITYIGAYESAFKVKFSNNADVIPIEMCVCLIIFLSFQTLDYTIFCYHNDLGVIFF